MNNNCNLHNYSIPTRTRDLYRDKEKDVKEYNELFFEIKSLQRIMVAEKKNLEYRKFIINGIFMLICYM